MIVMLLLLPETRGRAIASLEPDGDWRSSLSRGRLLNAASASRTQPRE